jgi:hypothetical protein
MSDIINNIYNQYPRLKKYATDIEIRMDKLMPPQLFKEGEMGQLEFFPKGEKYSPNPEKNIIEVYNPHLKDEWLEQAIFGDMLHALPYKDSKFTELRDEFKNSLTENQLLTAVNMYEREKTAEPRSFIRGYIAPDKNDEWRKNNFYTEEQEIILDDMISLLKEESSE